MARSTLTFTAQTTKQFATNYKRGPEYTSTIQNLTNQSVTITVTNQRIQGASPTFDTPAGGAVVIAAGAIGAITAPYAGWLLTAGGSATGTVEIVEAG
jgi:hypothetical protein